MKSVALAWCLVLAPALGAAAQAQPVVAQASPANISDDDLRAYLGNLQIEARLDADVTGDGQADVVYVARNEHERLLGVLAGGQRTAQLGRRAIDEGVLDPSPQAPIALGFDEGVLTVEDLSGDRTVTLARYQYRYDSLQNRMRLFTLVCEQYSPTFSHGSIRLSWDLQTGDHVVEHGLAVTLDTGEDVYVYEPENRTSRRSPPVFMEDVPSVAEWLAAQASPQPRVASGDDQRNVDSP